MIAVGVDPGAVNIGVVSRIGDELLTASVLTLDRVVPPLTRASVTETRKLWAKHAVVLVANTLDVVADLHNLGDSHKAIARRELVLGVENVTKPHPFGGRVNGGSRVIDPGPIIDTAVILGALLGCWPDLVLIRPHRNGSGPTAAYPEQIRSRVRGLGGPSIHARSAWDVAGAALAVARLTSGDALS